MSLCSYLIDYQLSMQLDILCIYVICSLAVLLFIHPVHIAHFTVTAVTFSDTFNENTPPTNEPAYISSLGSAIYEAMSRGNKNAVWLMQVCSHPSFTFEMKNIPEFFVIMPVKCPIDGCENCPIKRMELSLGGKIHVKT